jgi:hypothetical protein
MGRIPDSGASKKLAGLFINNLVRLVNLAPSLFCTIWQPFPLSLPLSLSLMQLSFEDNRSSSAFFVAIPPFFERPHLSLCTTGKRKNGTLPCFQITLIWLRPNRNVRKIKVYLI